MDLARRARFLCRSAALGAVTAAAALCMGLGALGLLIAAFIIWLSHMLGIAAAVAIGGGVLLIFTLMVVGFGMLALRHMRARQPSLMSEAIGMLSLGLRLATLMIRRDPSKVLLAAMIAGGMAEHFSRNRQQD
ncbi:MAG: hypothetical protein KGQ79_02095 [Proteobacteria bacterium]|nr:hypothetical protein [Pseudomonadota bacterium]MBU6425297.1 hypothetical protein [Rhodospirillales bacterium]